MRSLEGEYISKNGNYGDAMSANAACALALPTDPRPHKYMMYSFKECRPYRSPSHAADPNVDLTRSFSRDHVLSLCWYGLFSASVLPIIKVARYAKANKFKIGAEGTYSQHGYTPNVAWATSAVLRHYSVKYPWWYLKIWPSFVIALIQLLSVKSVPVGYRLNLCCEMSLLAKLTGQWNFIWKNVADICVKRQPENLYYQFVARGASQGLLDMVNEYLNYFEESDEWCWCWMHKTCEGRLKACGPELLMLKTMIEKELRNEPIA